MILLEEEEFKKEETTNWLGEEPRTLEIVKEWEDKSKEKETLEELSKLLKKLLDKEKEEDNSEEVGVKSPEDKR